MPISGDDIRLPRRAGVGGNLEYGQVALDITREIMYAGMNSLGTGLTPVRAVVYYGSTAPASPPNGYLHFDTDDATLKVYDGGSWTSITGGGGGGLSQAQVLARGLGA
jgi:hypothetical protein